MISFSFMPFRLSIIVFLHFECRLLYILTIDALLDDSIVCINTRFAASMSLSTLSLFFLRLNMINLCRAYAAGWGIVRVIPSAFTLIVLSVSIGRYLSCWAFIPRAGRGYGF